MEDQGSCCGAQIGETDESCIEVRFASTGYGSQLKAPSTGTAAGKRSCFHVTVSAYSHGGMRLTSVGAGTMARRNRGSEETDMRNTATHSLTQHSVIGVTVRNPARLAVPQLIKLPLNRSDS